MSGLLVEVLSELSHCFLVTFLHDPMDMILEASGGARGRNWGFLLSRIIRVGLGCKEAEMARIVMFEFSEYISEGCLSYHQLLVSLGAVKNVTLLRD